MEVLPDALVPAADLERDIRAGRPVVDPLLQRLIDNHVGPLAPPVAERRVRSGLGRPREIQQCEWHRQGRELPREDRLPYFAQQRQADIHGNAFPLAACGCERHIGQVNQISHDDWNNPDPEKRELLRRQVLYQMWGENTGLDPEFYATKDTYREDAGHCYNRHDRPGSENGPYGCVDWESDSRRLTDEHWMERTGRPHIYLCTFCPYQSVVTTRIRSQRGDYDQ